MASTLFFVFVQSPVVSVCFVDGLDGKMETVLGEMEVELDGRFCSIRNTETNLGINFFYFC